VRLVTGLPTLIDDLRAEQDMLDAVVADLPDDAWTTPTPSPGFEVRDQIGHLAFFDRAGTTALRDPDAFTAELGEILADVDGFVARSVEEGRALEPAALLADWRAARTEMLAALADLPDGARIPWYGPSQSGRSFATARLMETWAHGLDVIEGLHPVGLAEALAPTDRLAHICHLGVATRGWSFVVRDQAPPDAEVRVELTLPSGQSWSAGSEEAVDRVIGAALDFCLVVTQRRHVDDTDLVVDGDTARAWMAVAQCFAGAPTLPPQPGTRG
jgi:uncharacterized protein (TIGR03084 family)